ncbi:putative Chromo-like domain superfamily, trmO-like domain, YaeB-like superfamily protein [Plasmopara halstedii]
MLAIDISGLVTMTLPFGLRPETLVMTLQTAVLLWLWRRHLHLRSDQTQTIMLQDDVVKKEKKRIDERQGRVAAERELRRVMEEKLDTSKGCYVQPIGIIHSCFKTCLGTPRQGSLAPSTRAKIVFQRSISPDSLVGLEHFSHIWIIFVFHLNTNGKYTRAHDGLRSDSHRHTFRVRNVSLIVRCMTSKFDLLFQAKVSPPVLKARVGIFCTRSPHRPNPIGITLTRVERVDMCKRTVYLTGVDLLDGTPVLDIKPYIAAYDSLPDALTADWVSTPQPSIEIEWKSSDLASTVRKLATKSEHYRDAPDALVAAIEEILLVDVRSKYQTRRWTTPDHVSYQIVDTVRVKYCFALSPQPKLHTDGKPDTSFIQILAVDECSELSRVFMAASAASSRLQSHRNIDIKLGMAPSSGASTTVSSVKCGSLNMPGSKMVAAIVERTPEKPESSERIRRRDRHKPTPVLKKKQIAKCVGYYVDALDKKMLWGEARIIKCNPVTRKILVHFVGWSKNYDLWTDPMSITEHGRYAPRSKDKTVRSWDGNMHLFEDILGSFEENVSLSVSGLVRNKPQGALKLNSDKLSGALSVRPNFQRETLPINQKIDSASQANAYKKDDLSTVKVTERKKSQPNSKQGSNRMVAKANVKKRDQANVGQLRSIKKKKSKIQLPTAQISGKSRLSTNITVHSPNQLPLNRDLELDDGTVLEFSSQREQARVEHESMQKFLGKCAVIWKKQLALSKMGQWK